MQELNKVLGALSVTDITMLKKQSEGIIYTILDAIKSDKLRELKPSYKESIAVTVSEWAAKTFERDKLPEGTNILECTDKIFDTMSKISYNIERYRAEYSNQHLQLVSQFVIYNHDKTKLFLATKKKGEDRLLGMLGLIGGHINNLNEPYTELWEESRLQESHIEHISTYPTKLLYTTTKNPSLSNVSDEHLGLVYEVVLKPTSLNSIISVDEKEVSDAEWHDIEYLKSNLDKYKLNSWLEKIITTV